MTEPIPVSLAIRAVERAILECDAATPGPWLQDDDCYVFAPNTTDDEGGCLVICDTKQTRANAKHDMDFIPLARAAFRASLEYLLAQLRELEAYGDSLDFDLERSAVAPLIAHYDAVHLIPALLARIEAAEDRANHTKVEAKMAEWDREAAHADLVVASHRMTDALLLKPALRLIQADPHLWSKRPCQTCDAVSAIAGEPFGCVKKRMEAVNG